MASITLPIRAAVIANPSASVDDLLKHLTDAGHQGLRRDTISTIRSDTLATLRLLQDAQAVQQTADALINDQPIEKIVFTKGPLPAPVPEKKKARKRPPSRAQRWADATSTASAALASLKEAVDTIEEIKQEFQDWKDNLPENLAASALGEKLETLCDLELPDQSDLDDMESKISDLEGADLPLGFGRD